MKREPIDVRKKTLAAALLCLLAAAGCRHRGRRPTARAPHAATEQAHPDLPREPARAPAAIAADRPRPLAPLTASRVTARAPRLRWQPLAGSTATEVQLCRAADCASVALSWRTPENEARPEHALAPGEWYWRLRALRADGTWSEPSAAWMFRVGHGNAAVATARGVYAAPPRGMEQRYQHTNVPQPRRWLPGGLMELEDGAIEAPTVLGDVDGDGQVDRDVGKGWFAGDVDGDGYADRVVVLSPEGPCAVVWGGPRGLAGDVHTALGATTGWDSCGRWSYAGDVDGDGLADLAVLGPEHALAWVRGRADRTLALSPPLAVPPVPGRQSRVTSVASEGDWNGDGYSDLLAVVRDATAGGPRETFRLASWRGGPAGLVFAGTVSLGGGEGYDTMQVAFNGDYNADGRSDLVLMRTHRAYGAVWYGRASGWARSPDAVLRGGRSFEQGVAVFGDDPSGDQDVDGDGVDDLVFAEVGDEMPNATRVWYRGGRGGIDPRRRLYSNASATDARGQE